jgi:hypothetical protein
MTKLVAGGSEVQIQIIQNASGPAIPLGLVTGASFDEDFGIQGARVIGYLGPVSYDSQDYSCMINLGTYVPQTQGSSNSNAPYPDGGQKTLADYLPTRAQIQSNNGVPGGFNTLQFVNTATGAIVNQFENVIIASDGTQISPNSYLTNNVRLMAVERSI